MIQIDINMPIGCIYEGDNGKTEYCPLCNHDDVPYCQYLDDDEAALGIDERPCYCPLYKSEPQWIPVSQELPEDGKVVIAIGKKGTWDVGTYRGFLGDNIHRWQWKKNTIKTVYWWMYKENALPEPYKGDEE